MTLYKFKCLQKSLISWQPHRTIEVKISSYEENLFKIKDTWISISQNGDQNEKIIKDHKTIEDEEILYWHYFEKKYNHEDSFWKKLMDLSLKYKSSRNKPKIRTMTTRTMKSHNLYENGYYKPITMDTRLSSFSTCNE